MALTVVVGMPILVGRLTSMSSRLEPEPAAVSSPASLFVSGQASHPGAPSAPCAARGSDPGGRPAFWQAPGPANVARAAAVLERQSPGYRCRPTVSGSKKPSPTSHRSNVVRSPGR
jgi:hypothetical protein